MPTSTFEFDAELTATVDSLRIGDESRSAVIRRAVALLKVVTDFSTIGGNIMLTSEDGSIYKEIVLNGPTE